MRIRGLNVLAEGILLLVLAGSPSAGRAASTVLSAAPLDAAPATARGQALGGAMVGLADDASAVFFNSAGLASLQAPDLSVHNDSYLLGVYQDDLAFGLPLGRLGTLGLDVENVDYGTFEGRDSNGVQTQNYSGDRMGAGLHYAWNLGEGIAAGLGLRGTSETLAQTSYASASADLGLRWEVLKGTVLGLAYRNAGTNLGGAPLTAPFNAGASQAIALGQSLSAILALQGEFEADGMSGLDLGVELAYRHTVALRLGYQGTSVPSASDAQEGPSLGAGFHLGHWALDYAYTPFGSLGNSQWISLDYGFGASAPDAALGGVASMRASGGLATGASQPGLSQPQAASASATATASVLNLQFTLPPDAATRAADLEAAGNWQGAFAALEDGVKQTPADARLWRALGDLYMKFRKGDYAAQCYQTSLKLDPAQAGLRQWLQAHPGP